LNSPAQRTRHNTAITVLLEKSHQGVLPWQVERAEAENFQISVLKYSDCSPRAMRIGGLPD